MESLNQITLVVNDYDEAIAFYTQKLNFELLEDTHMTAEKRWVRIKPAGSIGFSLLLAKAANEAQKNSVGNQTGGRVFLFLYTDDFNSYFDHLKRHNVSIIRPPSKETYGTVAVFADLYGNLIDLIETIT
jgi:catechol 2,3-dioxygenase-like lactoylglutathione lyase family enzyme